MAIHCIALAVMLAAIVQTPAEQPPNDASRQARLRFLIETANKLTLRDPSNKGAKFTRMEQPVLRYDNVIGLSTDGATFLWLDEKRPVAAISFSIRGRQGNAVYRECTSLWATPLECRDDESVVWAPKHGGLMAQRLRDAPVPADGERPRLAQMRDIAWRFSVTWHHSRTDEVTQLALKPAPHYRFAAENEGILDGALFVFSPTIDPEMLLLIEAVRDKPGEAAYWRYSLARMSSLKEVVRLDDREIWSVLNYHQDKMDDKKNRSVCGAGGGTI
jgi:hypothetical protein